MDQKTRDELVKEEILEIVNKFDFWMMTKNNLESCAGFIQTPNREVYIEIIFPDDYPETPIILNIPRDLREHPVFFESLPQVVQATADPNFHASQVIDLIKYKIISLPSKVDESLIDQLEDELDLVQSIYNVKTVEGKKYHIRIFYSVTADSKFEVEINYKDYPKKPRIRYYHGLEKLVGPPKSLQVIQTWDTNNPAHIVKIVQEIEHKFTIAKGIDDRKKLISVKNLALVNSENKMLTQNLSFSAMRGDIIGVFCFNRAIPLAIFNAFIGKTRKEDGEINVFGGTPEDLREEIDYIDFHLPPETAEVLNKTTLENILSKKLAEYSKKEAKT